MPGKAIRYCAAAHMGGLGLALVAAMTLAACELMRPPEQPEEPAHTAAAPKPDGRTRIATVKPEAKPKVLGPAAAARPSARHQGLVGLGEEEVTRLLGEPREVRNDPPAMVWQYEAGGCALDLFFYLDLKSQDFRALAYNFESGASSDELKNACLGKIQEANRDRGR